MSALLSPSRRTSTLRRPHNIDRMGGIPIELAAALRDGLGLERAIETGTYHGGTARLLAGAFPSVTTIELSPELHEDARERLADVPAVLCVQGDSSEVLRDLVDPSIPTLYWLDGHWSGGPTAGAESECPVLAEIQHIGRGHPDDCLLIDDARLFIASPPPPHDPAQWPSLVELFDVIRESRPDVHVTVVADVVIAVPARAKPLVDRHAHAVLSPAAVGEPREDARGLAGLARRLLSPR
jgi:hypothetical protein